MAIFDRNDLEGMKDAARLQIEIEKSGKKYLETIKDIGELNKTINYMEGQLVKLKEEELELEKDTTKAGEKALIAKRAMIEVTKANIQQQKRQKQETIETVEAANKLKVVASSTLEILKASSGQVSKGLRAGFNAIAKDNSLQSMSKSINQAGLGMGLTSTKTKQLSKNLQTAYHHNAALGVGVGELAKMQASYSDEVGRAGMLTENSLQAMMQLSKFPGIGADGAAGLSAEMDNFGISVAGTRDLVDETVQSAGEMGLNAGKVVKTMQKNMRLAQRYHFKGGVKGLASMAKAATKLKMNMDSIGGMADKVFRPEGAVEVAAKLQTMGGSMAALADPFKLMFKARNDFEGFAKDIGNATKEFAKFNSKTGEFEISGYQLDRMREIAEITGIGVEDLSKMGKEAAKFDRIESLIPPMNIKDEDRELISSIAEFDKDSGKFMVTINGKEMELDKLDATLVAAARGEKQNMDARIKAAKTFDESFSDLVMQLKTFLLPIVEGLNETLTPILQDVMKQFGAEAGGLMDFGRELGKDIGAAVKAIAELVTNKEFIDGIIDFTKTVGGFVKTVAKFVAQNPKLTAALVGMTYLAGPIMSLVKVFGLLKSFGSGLMTLAGSISSSSMGAAAAGSTGAMASGLGIGAIGMLGSMGLDYGRSKMDDPNSTGGKWMGVGSQAAKWGGIGAMAGSIIPGVGTAIGAGVGAVGGGLYGAYDEGMFDMNDGAIVNGKPISFDSKDSIMLAAKKDGTLDKVTNGNASGGGTSKMEVSYKPIDLTGTITLAIPNGQSVDLDIVNNPQFQREITKIVHAQTSTMLNGGVATPKNKA